MGFPDMRYLDEDFNGSKVEEKTLYKEFMGQKDNDLKQRRDAYSN
jgi:hypothetical protein